MGIWLNFNFLQNSQEITFPTLSCLVLYSLYTGLLHWLIWYMLSDLSSLNLHVLISCILSISLLYNWLFWYCFVISVSLLEFLFRNNVQLCASEISHYVAWNIHTMVFFQFLFLVIVVLFFFMLSVLILAVAVSIFLAFLMQASNPPINASSSFFSWDIFCLCHLKDIKTCHQLSCSLVHLSILRTAPNILQSWPPRCLSFWWDF